MNSGCHGNIYVLMGKKVFSETTRPTALLFGMWQRPMVLYMNCAMHAHVVKFGHAPGVHSLHRFTTIGKPSNSPTGRLASKAVQNSGERLKDHWSSGFIFWC